jgi:hypothetical protein
LGIWRSLGFPGNEVHIGGVRPVVIPGAAKTGMITRHGFLGNDLRRNAGFPV